MYITEAMRLCFSSHLSVPEVVTCFFRVVCIHSNCLHEQNRRKMMAHVLGTMSADSLVRTTSRQLRNYARREVQCQSRYKNSPFGILLVN